MNLKKRFTAGLAGAVMASLAFAVAAQTAGPEFDGSRDARTIQLLLQLQGAASSPAANANAEPPAARALRREPGAPATADANPFAIRPVPGHAVPQHMPLNDQHVGQGPPQAARSERAEREGTARPLGDQLESNPEISQLLPVRVLRFVRENRELVIGLSLGALVLLAIAGASAGSGAKRR